MNEYVLVGIIVFLLGLVGIAVWVMGDVIRSLGSAMLDNNAEFESSARLAHDKVLLYADQQIERIRIEAGGSAEPSKPLGSAGGLPSFLKINTEQPLTEPAPDYTTNFGSTTPNIVGD